MATEIDRIIQEIVVDDREGTSGVQRFQQSLDRLQRTAAETDRDLDQVSQSTGQSGRAATNAAGSYDRLRGSLDPAHRAAREFERGVDTINRALRQGIISQNEAADSLRRLRDRYQRAGQESERFGRSAQHATSGLSRMSQAAQLAAGTFAAMGGAMAIREITQLTSAALASANALNDQAQSLGFAAETLQEYQFAAVSVGVEQGKLDSSLERFTRRLGEARQGTGALADVAERLNLDLSDSEDALQQVFEVLASTEDAADRAAIAYAAFGREGVAIARMADDLADLRQEARDLGAVMGDELTDRAADLNTALAQTRTAFESAFNAGLLREVVPPLEEIAAGTRDLTALAETLGTVAGRATTVVLNKLIAINTLLSGSDGILAKLEAFARLTSPLFNIVEGAGTSFGIFGAEAEEAAESVQEATEAVQTFTPAVANAGSAAADATDQVGDFFGTLADENRLLFELSDGLRDGLIAVGDLATERRVLNEAQRLGIDQGTLEFDQLRDLVEINTRMAAEIQNTVDAHRDRGQAAERAAEEASRAAEREIRETQKVVESVSRDVSGLLADAIFDGTQSAADAAAQYLRRAFNDMVVTPVIRPTTAKVMS